MSDEWMHDVGRTAREQIEAENLNRFDLRWDAYAAGTLAEAEQAALLAEAWASAQGRQAAELFRPLDDSTKKDLARQALSRIRAESSPSRGSTAAIRWWKQLQEQLFGPGGSARRPPQQGIFGRLSWAAAAAATVAALVGLRLLTQAEATLPPFNVAVRPASSEQRSDTEALAPDEPFRIRLQPAKATAIRPEVRLYVGRQGSIERWPTAEEKAKKAVPTEDGVLFFETPPWDRGPGTWTLFVVLGRPGTLPSDDELVGRVPRPGRELRPPDGAAWQLLVQELAFAPRQGP